MNELVCIMMPANVNCIMQEPAVIRRIIAGASISKNAQIRSVFKYIHPIHFMHIRTFYKYSVPQYAL